MRERQRQRRHRDPVRIVGVHDVRPQRLTTRAKPPRRRQVDLGPRRDRNQLEPFAGAPPQLAVGVRDERRAMADLAQAVHGQQHLVLPAAPRAGGVDVKREHSESAGLRGCGGR